MTSSGVIMPRSPWLASPGWTKKAGVPVEAKVAAILRATWPDLPMPVTMTRPLARADQLDRGDEGLPEPVMDGGGQRSDAAGLGIERAQAPISMSWLWPDLLPSRTLGFAMMCDGYVSSRVRLT